jgi:diguanylate cyclase (GGDEF)-like protein
LIRGPFPGTKAIPTLDLKDPSLLLLHEDIGESYNAVTRSAAAAVGAEASDIALYDAETDELVARRPRYLAPQRPVPQYRFPLGSAPASAQVVRTGTPHFSNDPASDPLYDPGVKARGLHSVLTVPVRRKGQVLGLIYARNKPGGFTAEDVETLTALAGAAAVTLENIKLYAQERDRRVLSESLREVSRTLLSTLSEDSALAAVLDQMWRVVRYRAACAVVIEAERLRVAASRGGDTELTMPLHAAGELRTAIESRQLCLLPDLAGLPDLGMHAVSGGTIVAPLLARGQALGAFVVVFDADHTPGLRDGQLVSAFADHAALFLEAGAVLRRERQARVRTAAVARITRLAASRHEPESLLQAVAPELLAASGAERAVLYLRHVRNAVLIPVTSAGAAAEEEQRVQELRLDMTSKPLGGLLDESGIVAFEEPANPPPGSITPFGATRALLVVPMRSRDEVIGAALLAWVTRPRPADPALADFLKDVAQQVALGVENARLFAALSQMASTDELTQLSNRRRFSETLRLEVARSRRAGTPLSLVLGDLDHLKRVNDSYGHPAGDAAIRHAADAFKRGRRETDLAARLGGEEFALLLPGSDPAGAIRAAERIRAELAASSLPVVGTVTLSMGVASFPEDASSEEELVRVADERLYAAKAAGRNCVVAVSEAPVRPQA